MASSTPPPHCSLNSSSKSHHIPNPNPPHHRRNNRRLPPPPSIAAAAASAGTSSTTGSATLYQAAGEPIPSCPSYIGPEFRRARTTRVISKRNTHSPKPSHDHHRAASPAAAACLAQLVNLTFPDDRSVAGVIYQFQPSLAVPEDYCCILHELGDRDKHPAKALALSSLSMPLMRTATEKGRLLTATIGALGRMGRHDLARHVFEAGVSQGYGNTVFAYSALISAYARNGLSSQAIAIFETMKAAGLRPNNVSYNAVIDACVKGGLNLSITLSLFREMIQYGLHPDRKTFNSLLAGCSRAGRLDDARAVLEEMVHSGIGRDIYTYNTFVDALCKCGNMELALQVVADMHVNGVSPNVVTYSTLIDGYSKLERFDDALRLYEEMKLLKLRLDRVCYNTLLSIYVKTGRYEDIARVYEEMDALRIEKDTVTYNSLINGYGKQGRFDVVTFLLQDMRDRGISPSVLTYSTLIDIYSKAGMYGEAANVFLEFKESGLKADVVLYSSFIDALSKNGMVECAVWLLDEMTRMGVEPNVVTYNTIIDAFGKSRVTIKDGGMDEVAGSEYCNGQIQNTRTLSQLAKGIGRPILEETRKSSEELFCILGLFQRMNQQGIKPNVVTFSAILNACSRCNSFEDATLLLEQLRLFDNSVYGVAHGLLIGSREVWVQAQTLFDELRQMDQPTSSAFYNALTDMLWHFGQKRGAQKVVLEGVQRKVWEKTWTEFSLDLHLMSTGAAQAMVHAWLLSVRTILFQGRQLPEFVSILTGWGKHSKVAGSSTLRRVIEALLNSIGAPFQIEKFNIGRFVSPGPVVAAWLRETGTVNVLLLCDERSQTGNLSSMIPRLQAIQL